MQVDIYTTPTCPYCKQTKTFFKENDVDYEEHDVAENNEAAQTMIEKSGQRGVPVTIVQDEEGEEDIIVGFNKEKLEEALGV